MLDVERLKAEVGDTVNLGVLMLGGNGEAQVGTPEIEGAKVVAEVVEHGRDKKILVFKYKNKTRYRRRHGHRQGFTRLAIKEIVTEGGEDKPKRTRKAPAKPKKKEEAAEAAVEATVEATAEMAEAPAEEKPKRAARKAPAKKAAGEKKPAAKPRARKAAPKAEKPAEESAAEEKPAGDAETEE